MGNTWRKLLALTLSVSMITGMFTVGALATGEEEGETTRPAYCGQEAHTHSIENGCYEMTCGQEEGEGAVEGHTHTEDCYTIETSETPVCGQEEAEAMEGHTHTDDCYEKVEVPGEYTCENTEDDHVHDENCPRAESTWTQGKLICNQEETEAVEGHSHTEACHQVKTLICDKEEAEAVEGHHHTDACYDTATTICEFTEEHTHSLVCYMQWEEETATLTINGTGAETVTKADVSKYKTAQNLNISNVALIEKEVFAEWKQLKNVNISNVGTIGYAFRSTSVEEVTIDNVDTIETYAFYNPANLKKVTISNVKTVGNNIFNVYNNQTVLTDVFLTNTDVGYQMFAGHNKLANLTMDNVGAVGFQAFMNCTSLNLTSLDASQVKSLGKSAFLGCTSLTELTVDGVEVGITTFYGCTGLTEVTLKNTTIGQRAFTGCTGLKTVTLENITDIGLRAFSAYGNTQPACTALETVNMTNVTTTGNEAFVGCSSLKNVDMTNVTTIDVNSFASCTALETISIPDGVNTIGQYAFYNCTGLKNVTMGAVNTIDQYAFWGCSKLENINSLSNVTGRIGGFAFYGCENLTGLTVEDMTKMGYNGSVEMMERMQAILAGRFQLDNADEIGELALETGWTAGAVDRSDNWNAYNNGTQLMEQARWQDTDNGVAEVKVDAYYTGEKQMDYIFVADLSASMAQLGNPEDSNARFYDMQSKLLDMTGKLLDTDGYDCQVAIVTFGGYFNGNKTVTSMNFSKDAEGTADHIKGLEPLNENTDYVLGLNKVLEVLEGQEDGRNTVVVFLSDGAPNMYGDRAVKDCASEYTTALRNIATQMGGKNVPVYGVLHSPTAASRNNALVWMEVVCGKGNVYESTDTESFGEAMNAAFAAAYGNNTVTIPVNANDFDVSSLDATAGEAVYDEAEGVITWILNGMPFTQHTLTYRMALKEELAGRYGSYSYNINNGDATFGANAASVGLNLQLTRTRTSPSTGDSTSYYTLTIHYVYADGATASATVTRSRLERGDRYSVTSPVIEGYTADTLVVEGTMPGQNVEVTVTYTADEDISDPDTPLVETPEEKIDEPDTPLAETPEEKTSEEELTDEEPPLAEAPQTGDSLMLWAVLALLSAFGLAGLFLAQTKSKHLARRDRR